ncbi:MAG: hypothetical protein WCS30_13030 [Selenomonadaceae bacterium]
MINYKAFVQLYTEATEYSSLEMFVTERGWQEWMELVPEEKIADVLEKIYNMAKIESMPDKVRYLINLTGLSQAKFATVYGFSIKAVEAWLRGTNKCSNILLLAFAVNSDGTDEKI